MQKIKLIIFKKVTPIFLVVLTLLLPSLSFGGGNSGAQIIERVYVDRLGVVQIFGEGGNWTNPDFCQSQDRIIFLPEDIYGSATLNYSEGYALIVASLLQGNLIDGWLEECGSPEGHYTTYPILTGVSSYK